MRKNNLQSTEIEVVKPPTKTSRMITKALCITTGKLHHRDYSMGFNQF